jgi:Ca2+-binding EF-hand superfamily protein
MKNWFYKYFWIIEKLFFFLVEIDELFKVFDKNGDNSISTKELGAAMRFLGLRPSNKEIADTMKLLDSNGKLNL